MSYAEERDEIARLAPKKLTIPQHRNYRQVMPELIKKAKLISKQAEDITLKKVNEHEMVLEEGNRLCFRFGEERRSYRLRPLALHQLCEKLSMPPSFFNYLEQSNKTRDLAYENINRLLRVHKGDMFIRTCNDEIRGILSPRYACFDSDKILKVISFFLEHNPFIKSEDIYVDSYINDMERFHLRISSKLPVADLPDSDIRYGLMIDSSDVGLSRLRVRFFIYKVMCTNGLVYRTFGMNMFSHSHIGIISVEEFAAGLTRSFQLFPQIAKQASSQITVALQFPLLNNGLIDFSKEDAEAVRLRERMARETGLGVNALKELSLIAVRRYGITAWGYVNAITEYAQRYDIERRLELEQIAGQILAEPDKYFVA